eukprot:2048221-Rhodomonas_salina.1
MRGVRGGKWQTAGGGLGGEGAASERGWRGRGLERCGWIRGCCGERETLEACKEPRMHAGPATGGVTREEHARQQGIGEGSAGGRSPVASA